MSFLELHARGYPIERGNRHGTGVLIGSFPNDRLTVQIPALQIP